MPAHTVAVDSPTLSRTVVDLLHREVNIATGRLVRNLQLPVHHREDLRQELLLDLIARFKRFDPARGTLNAFASVIIRHRAGRLGKRISRERAIFAPMFLTDSLADDPTVAAAFDTVAEAHGYTSGFAHHERFATIDRRLDLARALGKLRPGDLSLCLKLAEQTPAELSRSEKFSRATLYRRLRNIRQQLLAEGISCP